MRPRPPAENSRERARKLVRAGGRWCPAQRTWHAFIESFNGKFRAECKRALVPRDYNEQRDRQQSPDRANRLVSGTRPALTGNRLHNRLRVVILDVFSRCVYEWRFVCHGGRETRLSDGAADTPLRPLDERGDELKELQRALEAAGIEFTNGDQPGVRLTKAAAARPAEPGSAQSRRVAAKGVRGKTAKATEKKR